jgi:hypothetical protein
MTTDSYRHIFYYEVTGLLKIYNFYSSMRPSAVVFTSFFFFLVHLYVGLWCIFRYGRVSEARPLFQISKNYIYYIIILMCLLDTLYNIPHWTDPRLAAH